MRLSLAYEMQRPVVDDHAVIEETIEQCVLADKMGFDAVWFVEHHFLTSFSMSPCPEVIFGALSQRTKRIRLGFGVVILPYHHPVRVAERVAMVDHLSGGRVEFGTGRSAAYEQIGMGIDPRHTRAMWEESLAMIPKIWEDGLFSWEGQFWSVPPRDVRPKPYQKPHPRMWVAALQPATYQLAAEKGIGVMALSVAAPSYLEPHIKAYKERVRHATPVGKVDQRPVAVLDDGPLRRRRQGGARAGGEIAPDLLRAGSPVPEGPDAPVRAARRFVGRRARAPQARTSRAISRRKAPTARPRWICPAAPGRSRPRCGTRSTPTLSSTAASSWPAIPRRCLRTIAIHEAAGVDELQFLMATETVPHDKVMSSIEMFGRHVIPALKKKKRRAPAAARPRTRESADD